MQFDASFDVSFDVSGDDYDLFMGRYTGPLAVAFTSAVPVPRGSALDVGCGPGALTAVLAGQHDSVSAVDPSPSFVAACAARVPSADVRVGTAETLPFPDGSFDLVTSQLVLNFVSDPAAAVAEFRRVLRPGGVAAACVWEYGAGMRMLRLFWDAALSIDPAAPDEGRVMRFGRPGEIAALLEEAGFAEVEEAPLDVSSTYAGFEEFWAGFEAGIGPVGVFCASLSPADREALRAELFGRLDAPPGSFTLTARAWSASGRA